MKLGITGSTKSGKTTIFNAITKLNAPINTYDNKIEPNVGIVQVLDDRVTELSKLYKPQKTIYANIEVLDFPAMQRENENHEFLSPTSMGLLKTTDALIIVLRNFTDPYRDETTKKSNPINELKAILEEFMLSDLYSAERRLEKIELNFKRGVKPATALIEEKALRIAIESINNNIPLSKVNFQEAEMNAIKGYNFTSIKPFMIILNSGESNFAKNVSLLNELNTHAPTIEIAGQFEMELSKMHDEEAAIFREDMNISESAMIRTVNKAYALLGNLSFFTVGSDEVRAWTIQNGDNAITAAGKIHSDLARGFIRAETFNYEDIIKHGNEKTLREKGLYRLEGKTYIVKDGDIIFVRFNV